jgi:hypothetical protein
MFATKHYAVLFGLVGIHIFAFDQLMWLNKYLRLGQNTGVTLMYVRDLVED